MRWFTPSTDEAHSLICFTLVCSSVHVRGCSGMQGEVILSHSGPDPVEAEVLMRAGHGGAVQRPQGQLRCMVIGELHEGPHTIIATSYNGNQQPSPCHGMAFI